MDYEQKYNEALERAREYKKHGYMMINAALDNIFPELAESKDERIRKAVIFYFKNYKKQEECGISTFYGIPTDDILAWLEKQGKKGGEE